MTEYGRGVRAGSLALLVVLLVALCAAASYWTVQWARPPAEEPSGISHDWLHRELALTEEESEAVMAFEPAYREERTRLRREFNRRITALADLLRTRDTYSPEVEQAIHRLHGVHGQLQELSIVHYFDMLEVLPEEKRSRLRNLAVQALSEPE